jgi:hypothetical protein
MALKMKKTGLSPPVYENQPDYIVLSGGWEIGRIYEEIGSPPEYKWFWALALNGPIGTRADRVTSLEEAKAQLQAAWERWKAWAELEERPGPKQ